MDSGTHSGPPSRACAVTPSEPTPNIEASWMDSGIWGSMLLATLSRHSPLGYTEHSSFMLEQHDLPPPCPQDAHDHSVTGKGWSTGSAGLIRTRDRVFDSVSHLINHHLEKSLPIVSAGSELCLQQPVERNP
ncbi:Shc-Transforming Protein 3 [Manis pentadactyla]|nr:Shc-Transforming Protein 3 [Manis pentadactyla]